VARGLNGREDLEERFEAGHLEQCASAFVDRGKKQAVADALTRGVQAHERTESRGIHVGNFGEIQDQRRGVLPQDRILKVGDSGEGDWPPAMENEYAVVRIGRCYDLESSGSHSAPFYGLAARGKIKVRLNLAVSAWDSSRIDGTDSHLQAICASASAPCLTSLGGICLAPWPVLQATELHKRGDSGVLTFWEIRIGMRRNPAARFFQKEC
jgi:hypothetical protein